MGTILSFFTGSGSVWKIACIALLTAMLSLGIYTGVKISDKNSTIAERDKTIKDNAKEYKEAIKEKDEVIKKTREDLAQCNADKQTQNALIDQFIIDKEKKQKEFDEAMAKKPKIVTNIKYVPTGDDECKDLQNILDEYISTGAQQ